MRLDRDFTVDIGREVDMGVPLAVWQPPKVYSVLDERTQLKVACTSSATTNPGATSNDSIDPADGSLILR